MRISIRVGAAAVVLGVGIAAAFGQPAAADRERFFRTQRLIDDELERNRFEQDPLDALVEFDWGGWLDFYYFNYDDGVQSSRELSRPELALWTRLRIDGGAHELFARARLRYNYFDPKDEIDRQEDWWGPNFDQAWYQVDLGRALRLSEPSDPLQFRMRLGRQTVRLGTGFTLDMPQDAVVLDARIYDWRVNGLFGKSFSSYPNIDRSTPVDSHSDRCFYGVQLMYEGFDRHAPFVYALWNDDNTDERPQDFWQNYEYDSFYFGFGSQGEIAHNLRYWGEAVFESGHSYGDREFLRQDYIEAYGWDVGLEKLFDVPMRPRLMFEYMFGSGDAGRLGSPTNAAGGNNWDRRDTSFVAFGLRDTGIALSPVVSNLHIWKFGGSLAPLEHVELCRDLEVGSNWFLYHKNKTQAAISDPVADEYEGWVGWEMDYFINWRLASDLSWTLRWGTFFPGSAYSNKDCRHMLFTGLTWSF